MAFIRSDQQTNSRYSQGGDVDIKGTRLGYWDRRVFQKSTTDVPYTISSTYARRPDLLAYTLYGTPTLMWFILQYCAISDINEEMIEGKVIKLPTKARLYGELLSKSTI